MNDPTLVTLTQRLDRLEKQTRWWKAIGAVALAALALVLLAGARSEKVAEKVVTKRLIIVDKDRQPRAVLEVVELQPEGAPVLSFLTKDHAVRLSLGLSVGGDSRLSLLDKEGKRQAMLFSNSLALVESGGKILWKVP